MENEGEAAESSQSQSKKSQTEQYRPTTPAQVAPSRESTPLRRTSNYSNAESERTIRRRPSTISIASSSSKHSRVGSSIDDSASQSTNRYSQIKRRPLGKAGRLAHNHSHRIFSADDTEVEVHNDVHALLARTFSDYRPQMDRRAPSSAGKSKLNEQSVRATLDYEEDDDMDEDYGHSLPHSDADDNDHISVHSDASDESFTLKERQDAINKSHPFGIRIWKPAVYKKKRSVQKAADGEIHSTPGRKNCARFSIGNVLWTLLFGWWLSTLILLFACFIRVLIWTRSGMLYSRVLFGLARYMLYPFGQYVELKSDLRYAEEDEGLGNDLADFEDIEHFAGGSPNTPIRTNGIIGRSASTTSFAQNERAPLLGFVGGRTNTAAINPKRRAFGRGKWSIGRIVFFFVYYVILAPLLWLVSGICWLLVFPLPMAKLCYLLIHHLRSHPLALTFHWSIQASFRAGASDKTVLLCTYRAMGWQYYKYTVDGTVSVLCDHTDH